jgi:hypothetical protein
VLAQTHHLDPGVLYQSILDGEVPHDARDATDLEREFGRWHARLVHGCEQVIFGTRRETEISIVQLLDVVMAMVRFCVSVGQL